MSNIGFVPVALEADQYAFVISGGVMLASECVAYLDHFLLLLDDSEQVGTNFWEIHNPLPVLSSWLSNAAAVPCRAFLALS